MYRERKCHGCLFKGIGPKTWNFTGRAAIIPDLSDIDDLLACKENMTEPQIDITNLQPKDMLLGENSILVHTYSNQRNYAFEI